MGSYLTIINNTDDKWHCKIGPDEQALKISALIISVFGGLAFTIAALAGAVPLVVAGGGMVVTGVAPSALLATAAVTGILTNAIGSVSVFTMSTARLVSTELKNKGFAEIQPGDRHRYGRMTLSLWQQSQCIRMVGIDEKMLRVDTLNMRPIFSGSTANSNRNYDIKSWLERKGLSSQSIQAIPSNDNHQAASKRAPTTNVTKPTSSVNSSRHQSVNSTVRLSNVTKY